MLLDVEHPDDALLDGEGAVGGGGSGGPGGLDTELLDTFLLDGEPFGGGGGGGSGGFGGIGTRFVNGLDVERILNAPAQTVYFRARIADADGVVKDYSTRSGINWCHSCEYSETVDAPIASATVKLWREVRGKSTAPLKTGSIYNQTAYLKADSSPGVGPAIDVGRLIYIDVANVPYGTPMYAVADEAWHPVFEGYIRNLDWSKNPIELSCMDRGVALTDTWFPVPNTIFPEPANIQGAIAELLDLAHLDVFTPLYVPVAPDPEVVVGAFSYAIEPAMDPLQRIAQINGWVLRYCFNDLTQSFQLTFKDPGRNKQDPDYVIYPKSYVDVSEIKIDLATVRNDVSISFCPDNNVDENGACAVPRVTVYNYDPESVRRYGRRSMVIQEDDNSPINTADSANLMNQLIVFDLAQPLIDKTIDMPYAWFLELGNLIRFPANLVHSDEALQLFVVGLKHVLNTSADGRAVTRTNATFRGTPGSYWRWLGRRPAPPTSDPPGEPPFNGFGSLSQLPDYGTDHVQFDWAWGGDPSATFDLYTQLGTGGFTLAASALASPTYNFDVGQDIEPFHAPPDVPQVPITVSYYVIANVGGVGAATSRTSVASYGFGP